MNQLTQIENIYGAWDGTPNHAVICMRYINQIIQRTDTSVYDEFTTYMEQFNE